MNAESIQLESQDGASLAQMQQNVASRIRGGGRQGSLAEKTNDITETKTTFGLQ